MSALSRIAARLLAGDNVFARGTTGGIRPEAYKQHSLRSRIMPQPIPPLLRIPTGTAVEAELTLLVDVGRRVSKHQQLASTSCAEDAGSGGVVHAPTSGTILGVELAAIADHRDAQQLCVVLETDGQDESIESHGVEDFTRLSSAELIARISAAGIVGMGGAGFATASKLAVGKAGGVQLLIINAAECEPYISADEALIRERARHVIAGTEILRLACSAPRSVIAIEDSKTDAIAALREAIQSIEPADGSCTLVLVPSKYPAGSERQLIQCVSGVEIPKSELPTQHGILMHNVGTAAAAYSAVVEGTPCISRITTLCGETLRTPKNFEVLVGTSAEYLFDLCGIGKQSHSRAIVGGSLMGRELESADAVVAKTTNCLIAAGEIEFPAPKPEQACIRCGYCAAACPSKLLPQQLLAYCRNSDTDAQLEHGLLDCIECGACDYVCPSHIPLVSIYKESKGLLSSRKDVVERSEYWQQRFQFHQYRLKRDKEQALDRKAGERPAAPETRQASGAKDQAASTAVLSKEKASQEIAAAVARVKARRNATKPTKKKDESA